MAASSDAANRANTSRPLPGKATAVATRTTGLIAGAASRKVIAAAGGVPAPTSRPAMGTEPHSHPGRASPARPAEGIARAVRRGTKRRTRSGDTYAAIRPLTTTPRTRNGSAWMTIETNSVPQSRTSSLWKKPTRFRRTNARSSGTSSTHGPRPRRRWPWSVATADASASVTGLAGSCIRGVYGHRRATTGTSTRPRRTADSTDRLPGTRKPVGARTFRALGRRTLAVSRRLRRLDQMAAQSSLHSRRQPHRRSRPPQRAHRGTRCHRG